MTIQTLAKMGVERLEAGEIAAVLHDRDVGVLGLPAEGAPYMVPLSFGFDGDRTLFFAFVIGDESRKAALASGGGPARFLVYEVSSATEWRSVLATGQIEEVPVDDWDTALEITDDAWQPDPLESAPYHTDMGCFRLEVAEWEGIVHRDTAG